MLIIQVGNNCISVKFITPYRHGMGNHWSRLGMLEMSKQQLATGSCGRLPPPPPPPLDGNRAILQSCFTVVLASNPAVHSGSPPPHSRTEAAKQCPLHTIVQTLSNYRKSHRLKLIISIKVGIRYNTNI